MEMTLKIMMMWDTSVIWICAAGNMIYVLMWLHPKKLSIIWLMYMKLHDWAVPVTTLFTIASRTWIHGKDGLLARCISGPFIRVALNGTRILTSPNGEKEDIIKWNLISGWNSSWIKWWFLWTTFIVSGVNVFPCYKEFLSNSETRLLPQIFQVLFQLIFTLRNDVSDLLEKTIQYLVILRMDVEQMDYPHRV